MVGNGETTYFWTSNWSPFGKIRDYLREENTVSMGISSSSTLAELWDTDHWILPPARSEKQVQIYSFLTSLQINDHADELLWSPEGKSESNYSTRKMYDRLCNTEPSVTWHKEVWFSGGIPKHKVRTWLMVLNRSPTRDRILRWGLQTDDHCLLCNSCPETRSHLFFDCGYSWDVWIEIARRCGFSPTRDWEGTLRDLQAYRGNKHSRKLLLLAWQGTIYFIWSERNNRLHRNTSRSPNSIISEIDRTIRRKLASFRLENPSLSSDLLQLWFSNQ